MLTHLKITLLHCLPQHMLSRLMHLLTRIEFKPFKNLLIRLFIHAFHVDMSIAEQENPDDYKSFNAFFTRKLKKDARKKITDDEYEVFSGFGKIPTRKSAIDWAYEVENMGAGELLVSSIDKDGSLEGYDINLCQQISNAVSVPVVISSGCGNWKHVVSAFENGKADAACLTNIYHFTETSIHSAKKFLKKKNIAVRV